MVYAAPSPADATIFATIGMSIEPMPPRDGRSGGRAELRLHCRGLVSPADPPADGSSWRAPGWWGQPSAVDTEVGPVGVINVVPITEAERERAVASHPQTFFSDLLDSRDVLSPPV